MKIEISKQNEILQKLKTEFSFDNPCPICRGNSWGLNDTVFELREFNNGNVIMGGNQTMCPVIPLSCHRCGYTHFLSAVALGAVERKNNSVEPVNA